MGKHRITSISPLRKNSSRAKRSDIESFTPPVSAIPPVELLLKPEDTRGIVASWHRGIVAWPASLDKDAGVAKAAEPEPVDPAKLPGAN